MSGRPDLSDVGVVVVTYSPGAELDDFVASLDRVAPGIWLVLSDNGSTDGVPQRVAAERPSTTLLVNPDNPGYGAAVNAGVAAMPAFAEWILVCNPDLHLRPGTIERLRAVLEADPTAGVAGPRILDVTGATYPSARRLPSFRDGVGHALLARRWPSNPWTARYQRADSSAVTTLTTTGWLSGSCLLVRRRAFEQIGGFDPGYFMYFEDVDLGKRLAEADYRNVYVPDVEVVHIGGTTTSRHAERMLRAHHTSAFRYLTKKYPQPWMKPALWAVRAGLALRLRAEIRHARRNSGEA
jgi:N-acetylglucosaminyl-diphospho-decaprenol L-rhamnosyltransferase